MNDSKVRAERSQNHRNVGRQDRWCSVRTGGISCSGCTPATIDVLDYGSLQIGRDSPGKSLVGFLLVMMTMTSEGVVLPIGGVILEPFPTARVSPSESPVHFLDE